MAFDSKDFFLRDRDEFLELRDRLKSLVDIDTDLLDRMFTGSWSAFYAVDYIHFPSIEFGNLLKQISEIHEDNELYLYLRDEDSSTWPYGLSALKWPVGWTPEDYSEAFFFHHPIEATTWTLIELHSTSLIFGDSGKWVAMSSYHLELVLFGFRDSRFEGSAIDKNPLWLGKDRAIDMLLFNYHIEAGDTTQMKQRDNAVEFFQNKLR